MNSYRTAPKATSEMPPGIPYIIGNEAAERFSFYGMRGILLAYMTLYLTQPNGQFDGFSEKEAEIWSHRFVASAYFFPIIGGLLSDAFFGKFRTIISLSLVYCAGHACLALMELFGDTHLWLFMGLVLIAIGSGGIKPCVSAHVGDQFGQSNNHLLSRVFGWFYFSINFGAFLSGMLTPFLLEGTAGKGMGAKVYPYFEWLVGERAPNEVIFGPHYAFGLPGVLMLLATWVFWLGRNKFIHIQPCGGRAYFEETFSGEGMKAIGRISVIFAFIIMFWALFDQIGTSWQIQARSLDRSIPNWIPVFGGGEMLASQVAAVFNPLFILLLIPVFNYLIYPFIDRFLILTPLRKIGIGLFVMGLSFAMVAMVQVAVDNGQTPHMGWQILACAMLTASEVLVSITGLEFAYTQAPRQMKSFILSLFLLTVSIGNVIAAEVKAILVNADGSSKLPGAEEFWLWTALILGTAVIFVFVSRFYQPKEYLQEEETG